MVKVIKGDLFDSTAKYICHQVNCQGRMGSGVALQVKQKFYHVYDAYLRWCDSKLPILGAVQLVPCDPYYIGKDAPQYIVNMYAQDKYGYDGKQYTSIEAFRNCLNNLRNYTTPDDTIAMPYMIGCCRGGANWDEVYKLIADVLYDRNVELWKYQQ